MLWQRSLVMVDQETQSLWSHLLGKSMRGKLEGTVLETLPGTIMTWKAWKASYPNTTVLALDRTAREFVKEFHESPGRFVLGLRSLRSAAAYPFDILKKHQLVEDTFEDKPVVIFFDAEGTGGRAYSREANGRTLTFNFTEGKILDKESNSTWNLQGHCLHGPLKGTKLKEIPAIPSFAKAWREFYPQSKTYKAER